LLLKLAETEGVALVQEYALDDWALDPVLLLALAVVGISVLFPLLYGL
jgi:hypothetical protein